LLKKTVIEAPTSTTSPIVQETPVTLATQSVAEELGLGANFYNDSNKMTAEQAARTLNSYSAFCEVSGKNETTQQALDNITSLSNGKQRTITMDIDGDGDMEEVSGAEAVAASFDSELDLYIEAQVLAVMEKYGTQCWTGSEFVGFLCEEAKAELAEKGIIVQKLDNRTFTFSLVDKDGNIMEDEAGGKGSIIFGDWIIPDGYAQGAEQNFSSILDMMGHDCVSRADIKDKATYDQIIAKIEERIENGEYGYSDKKVNDIYATAETFQSGHGKAGSYSLSSGISGSSGNGESIENKDKQEANENKKELSSEQISGIKEAYMSILQAKLGENPTDEEKDAAKQTALSQVAQIFKTEINQVEKIVKT